MALTVESLMLEAGRALAPLEQRLRGGELELLFAEIGMPASDVVLGVQAVDTAVTRAADALGGLPGAVSELASAIEAQDAARIAAAVATAGPLVQAVAAGIDAVSSAVRAAATSAGPGRAEVEGFAAELTERLFGYAVATYLDREKPVVGHLFGLFGIIEVDPQPATPATPAHVRRVLRLDRIGPLLDDPVDALAQTYGWGTAAFDWDLLLRRLALFLGRVSDFAFVQPGAAGQPPFLRIAGIDVGKTDDAVPGVQAVLRLAATGDLNLTLPLGDAVALTARADAALEAGAAIELLPPAELHVVPPTTEVRGALRAGFQAPAVAGAPITVFGAAGATRIEARTLRIAVGADLDWNIGPPGRAEGAFVIEGAIDGGKVVLSLAGADGFLASVLPRGPLALDFDLLVAWSSQTGLHIAGSAGLEADLPVDFDVGPIKIQALHVGLGLAGDGMTLELSASVGAKLGPIAMAVERMGCSALLSFPDGGGNLGPADLDLGFKAPSGIGLSIDAGVVHGGGFIGFDPAKGEYSGVLELALGPVSIKAIAILTTRLPDGRDGWALLLLVFSEFDAIQLGYGFTLDGIGGIIGLQHGVSTQALQDGLRTGALDAVLFPADPVAGAPLLLGRLRVIFPIVPRALTVGPALKLGWSTPPIITLSLGLIVQIDDVLGAGGAQPQVSRVVLVGQLKVQLPPDAGADVPELLKLLVDIVGSYELREQALSIDARLRDSHVAGLPLTGSLVVRARFGDQPNLVLAVGGFHPRFTDLPPGLPAQERVGFELRYDIVTVRITGYVAVTTNTFQIGADADIVAKGGNFKIKAALGFDALFEFEPVFHFEIDFRVSASISYRGHNLASVKVKGVLRGPGRWEVSGHASFSILFWDVSIGFDLGWGDAAALPLASVAVGAQLVAALSDRANWAAELPLGGAALVTLRKGAASDGTVAAHPLGELVVTQSVVPLGVDITRVGTARPSDGTRFDIAKVAIAGRELTAPAFRDEHFARGRYLDLDPEQRLSTPSFERFRAGVEISSADFTVAADQVAFAPNFETVYLGEAPTPPERGGVGSLVLVAQARSGAASLSQLRRDERLVPADLDTRIVVGAPAFVNSGGVLGGATITFGSFTEAAQQAGRDGTLIFEAAELG